MPAKAAAEPKPAFSVTDVDFAREFLADREKFAKKYDNQWVEIEGVVSITPAENAKPTGRADPQGSQ